MQKHSTAATVTQNKCTGCIVKGEAGVLRLLVLVTATVDVSCCSKSAAAHSDVLGTQVMFL